VRFAFFEVRKPALVVAVSRICARPPTCGRLDQPHAWSNLCLQSSAKLDSQKLDSQSYARLCSRDANVDTARSGRGISVVMLRRRVREMRHKSVKRDRTCVRLADQCSRWWSI